MLGNRRYCYPLTITDFASRYLLACEALSKTQETFAFTVFERAFKDSACPRAIRTDNGVPFAAATRSMASASSPVWWLRLGHSDRADQPGHPEQNGRHERMHLTLKKEATKPAAANVLQQQARFDTFVERVQPRAAAPGARDEGARPTSTRARRASTAASRSSRIRFTMRPSR